MWCDVGIKSLLRSLCAFYRSRLIDFLKTGAFQHSSTAVEDMLVASIDADDISQDLSYDDLAMAIRILLNMTSGRRVPGMKTRRKRLDSVMQLPARYSSQKDSFKAKIDNLNSIVYSVKRKNLTEFVRDPANIFLLTYFGRNDGLAKTDPKR